MRKAITSNGGYMYVIIENSEAEIVIKKSKFIAHTFKIESKEQAEEILQKNKKKYFDAKHNCYAYRIIQKDCSILEKSSDDGEPSKTAGSPMLDILKGKELVNVLVIVTRFRVVSSNQFQMGRMKGLRPLKIMCIKPQRNARS